MEMDENSFKEIAKQLRRPSGDFGKQIASNMNISNAEMNKAAVKELNLQTNDRILEIGMGNGLFVKDIFSHQKNIYYTGMDYSAEMIEEASKLNKKFLESKKVEFILGSADKIPFNDKAFDKILTVNTIYFWNDPKIELSEIKRILKPSGEVIISIRPKEFMKHFPFTKYNFKMYSEKDLTDLLESNNFNIVNKNSIKEQDIELNGEFYPMEFLVIKATPNY